MKEKRNYVFYSKETKLLAVKMYLEQGKSQGQITEELGLPRKKLVELRVHQYRQEGEMAFCKSIGRPRKSTQSQGGYIARLEMENALLKKIPHRVAQSYSREARYRVIEHYRGRYPVNQMCNFVEISRAAYYVWRQQINQPDPDMERKEQILLAYRVSRKTYGYRRIGLWLRDKQAIIINHKAILRLMNNLGIHSIA